MPRNDTAAPGHVCWGISIHVIDIVQPPGIGMPPIADMDAPHIIVTAALAANISAETPKKARPEAMLRKIFLLSLFSTITSPGLSTHRGGATSCSSHYGPGGHGRAIDKPPKGRPVRARRLNRCGIRYRHRVRTRSCLVFGA